MARLLSTAALIAVASTAPVCAAPLDYLYYFGFDSSLTDYDGTGAGTATSSTGVSYSATGGIDGSGAASFSGADTNDGITVAESLSEATFAAMTWGAWVKSDGLGGSLQGILSTDNGGFDRLLGIDTRSSVLSGRNYAAFNGGGVYDMATIVTNEWIHLAAAYDGSTIALYVNGAHLTTISESWTSSTSMRSSFVIGANPNFSEEFSGLMDDVFVYGRTLDATEIADIYTNGFTTAVPLPAALPLMIAGLGGLAALRRRAA